MGGSYQLNLVALSLVVSVLASHTLLDVSYRLGAIRAAGRHYLLWLMGGAVAMGVGIWSMHFIGMLAFSMPIALGYDPLITACSLAIAIALSALALYVIVSHDRLSRITMALSGLLMGLGITGMHYTGMHAMLMHPPIRYDPWRVVASFAIAVLASWAGIWISLSLRNGAQHYFQLKRGLAAVLMGFAIAGMHYTGMSAMIVAPGAVCGVARGIDRSHLALAVAGGTLAVLALTFGSFLVEMRFSLGSLDALTGLQNRATFMRRMDNVLKAARHRGRPFALLFMDLDGFKMVNDSYGHLVGDMVLSGFAQQLRQCTRINDILARLGGDEFVLLIPELSDSKDAAALAESVTARLQHRLLHERAPVHVTTSIGIALFPQDGNSIEELLKNADTAMYGAKAQGRNTYRYFEPGMRVGADRILELQRGMEKAIEKEQFSLHFQAQFDSRTQDLTSAEALLRWNHPQLGEVSPGEFIPIAERTGQIAAIGNWVIREACAHMKSWERAGLPRVRVSINLSPQQMRQPNFVDTVHAIFVETNVPPQKVIFEITETVAMQDAEMTTAMIHHFQSLGFGVAIDDFGTGHSSLAYLQQFRTRQLKMDKLFTHSLDHHGEEGLALVTGIIALAHSLKMDVVAEGVETTSQLAHLQALACDQVQGFLLARPLRAIDFEDLLRTYSERAQGGVRNELVPART